MCGINRVSRVLANPGKSLNLKEKPFPGLECLDYLFSSISTKNVYLAFCYNAK